MLVLVGPVGPEYVGAMDVIVPEKRIAGSLEVNNQIQLSCGLICN